MAARAAVMANEAQQRQEELVAIARAVGVEVDLEPMDVPPLHTNIHDPISPPQDGDHQSPEAARSPSPLNAVPPQGDMNPSQVSRGEGLPHKPTQSRVIVRSRPSDTDVKARTEPSVSTHPMKSKGRDVPEVPPSVSSPKRCWQSKGKKVAAEPVEVESSEEGGEPECGEEAQSPVFMGVNALSHLSPETIDKSTRRLSVCYKRLERARAEIKQALKLNTQLHPNEAPLVPDWQVSGNRSVFHSKPGETSFEMYKACLLPQYQIALAGIHHARLEMLGAHLHHQLAEVMHAMSLQCSYWRYDRDDLQSWIQNIEEANESLKAELSDSQTRYLGAEERVKSLEAEKARLERESSDSQRAIDALKSEIRNLKAEVDTLKARENKAFEAGVTRGKSDYVNSSEYLEALKQARLGGARAFMQSRSFEAAVVKRATTEGFVSFYKCLNQLKLLKALKDGFDHRSISFYKDAELKEYPNEVVVDSVPEDEFAGLVEAAPSHPSSDVAGSSMSPS
ncbi:hypothetical protein Salat_2712500 [Sesamum alatum]|uniref:Uncharacterized protein n=1 Tax=Sesamum alatum TaxID=300844 RepID=A0AAE1XQE7_9LAMI|nr:hypothetical protein Salat_2712500 [Sesamum alatum]